MSVKNSCKEKWCPVGSLIETFERRNIYGLDYPFYGINKDKAFMPTVADTNNLDNTKYKIVEKGDFVFSGMQTGRDVCIRIALYDKEEPVLLSPAYTTFRIKDENKILPQYLFIQFNRFEMDRYGWFLSDGSIRSNLDWDRFCDIRIPLTSIEIQNELVATYNGLKSLAEQNEALIEPLCKACEAMVVDCINKYPQVTLGEYIEELTEKNKDNLYSKVLGLSTQKEFREPNSRVNKEELTNYKIVPNNCFAYVPTTDTWKVFACALNKEETIVVSPIYCVFKISNPDLLSEYLNVLFKPAEFDRYVRFNSWGSARENFNFSELCNVRIALPPIKIQQSVINLYNCLEEAKKIGSSDISSDTAIM